MKLVLDLSALQAGSFRDLQQLCREHEIWVPEALIFEALTKKRPDDRAKCFEKVQSLNSGFKLLRNVGNLCRLEIERDSDVRPENEAYEGITWINDARLLDKNDNLQSLEETQLAPWRTEIEGNVRAFMAVIADVTSDFPRLNNFHGGGASNQFVQEMRHVAESDGYVSRVFETVFEEPPRTASLRFKMLRFGFINAIEHIRKYGANVAIQNLPKDVYNSYLDGEYMTIASFADGLVSNDKRLRCLFNMVCPTLMCSVSASEVNSKIS